MKTAFIAKRPRRDGPTVGILAEYDALPGLGHACGHNLIASAALGAAIGASVVVKELPGNVVVYGTPAEEGTVPNAGGKVVMLGEIKKADVAIMEVFEETGAEAHITGLYKIFHHANIFLDGVEDWWMPVFYAITDFDPENKISSEIIEIRKFKKLHQNFACELDAYYSDLQ